MPRAYGTLEKVCVALYGLALSALLASMAVDAYFSRVDPYVTVPLRQSNEVPYRAGQDGEYWLFITGSPASRTLQESDLISKITCDTVLVMDKNHSLPVKRCAYRGTGSEFTLTFASTELQAGHHYDVIVNCSNYERLAVGRKLTLTIGPSPTTSFFRNTTLFGLIFTFSMSLTIAVILTVVYLLIRLVSGTHSDSVRNRFS